MQRLSLIFMILAGMALGPLSGCSDHDFDDACAGKYEKDFAQAAQAMKPFATNRQIASLSSLSSQDVPPGSNHSGMPTEEREAWENWAHSHLMAVQHLLDDIDSMRPSRDPKVAARHRQLKQELSKTADELVQVHGMIHLGYIEYAVQALDRLEQKAIQARTLACVPAGS
jgi:hypothetical protein